MVAFGFATYIGDEKWYRYAIMPAAQLLGGETSHVMAVKGAKYGLVPRMKSRDTPSLVCVILWCILCWLRKAVDITM